jgi:hypothetical protein
MGGKSSSLTETPSQPSPQPQELWCGRNSPCKPNNTGMDCANLGQRNAGLLRNCPAGYNSSEERGSCFLPMDRQRRCTLQSQSETIPVNSTLKYLYPGPGYCIPDPNNPSFFILRPENTPGWGPGQNCWVTDGTVTGYGQKPCSGGSLDECKRRIDGNGNVFFTELNGNIATTNVSPDRCMTSLNSLLTPECVKFCSANNSLCNSVGKSDPKKFFGVN